MNKVPRPVFVVGNWRSGTTITAKLLNCLPQTHIAKETGFITESLELLKQVPAPQAMTPLLAHVNSWLLTNGWTGRVSFDGFDSFCEQTGFVGPRAFLYYVWTLDSPQPISELRWIGDNTPLYLLAIPELLELLPDAHFIHVVRDPRDVICSTLKLRFGAHQALIGAMDWNTCLGAWLTAEKYLEDRVRTSFRYEDLCTDSVPVMQQLATFLGFQAGAAELALQQQSVSSAEATGFGRVAESAHHRNLAKPLSAASVGRYRRGLTREQIRQIEVTARAGMLACGYQTEAEGLHPLATENRLQILRAMVEDTLRRCWSRMCGR